MWRHLWLAIALVIPLAVRAQAHTGTSVISAAEDAFGLILGPQSLGLYNQSNVRGFDPIAAGNVRLDGLYFDQQGLMLDRLADRTRIRVGLAAAGFPWPAPTGIVDYTLRQPQLTQALTTIVYTGPYDSRQVDVDGSRSLWEGRAGVAAGASYRHDVYLPGYTSLIDSFALLSRWAPDRDLTVRTFWGRQNVTGSQPLPIIYIRPDQTPPRVPEHYFGQAWTAGEYSYQHYGFLVDAKSSEHWSLRTGIFRSDYDLPRFYTDLYLNTSSQGLANHTIVAEANQHYGSTSGEIRLSHMLARKKWQQQLDVGVRGRDSSARYGGSDAVDFGIGVVGQPQPLSFPKYSLHPETGDHIHEYSVATAYTLHWNEQLDFTAGVQRPSYSRDVTNPILGRSTTSVRPWLYNSSFNVRSTKHLVLFGALTRGLEDSGTAPAEAINRGAVLGAVRSSQKEAGVKYAFTASVTLVATAFDVQKPYFALDTHGFFGSLGRERHRGVELSLAGEVAPGLNVNAGAMFMSAHVTALSAQEPIGTRPVGQTGRLEQLGVDYRIARLRGLSLDCILAARGRRMARADNRVEIAGYNTLDLGARYQMTLGHSSATLRIQVLNVTNSSNWSVLSDGGLVPLEPRRGLAYLVVDL